MSGNQRPGAGEGSDPAEDDVVVPHPFGTGPRGERPPGPAATSAEGAEDSSGDSSGDFAGETSSGAAPAAWTGSRQDPGAPMSPGKPTVAGREEAAAAGDPPPGQEPVADAGEDPAHDRAQDTVPGTPSARGKRTRGSRDPLAAALIGVLTLLLGFAFAVQVRAVGEDQDYAGAREEDLVRILDDLNAREERLREQIADQRNALEQLTSSDSQSEAALEEARARAEAIGILNGTVAAQGPGLVITIRDPGGEVRVSDMVDAIQELRGAGAETMQIDGVRVGVSTAVTGTPGNLLVDGRPITSPYEIVVIGSPQNMDTALNIPGGVVQDLNRQGASVTIEQSEQVVVDALRPLENPQYASPDTDD